MLNARILVIDDSLELVRLLIWRLGKEGYDVRHAADGEAGLLAARREAPDLVLLDWELPGLDGLEVCRRLRMSSDVPILMLTAHDATPDKIRGLDSGANDYVAKPFDLEELVARVRAQLRGRLGAPRTAFAYADLQVDLRRVESRRRQRSLGLTPKELELLACLVREPERVVARERLIRTLWGPDYVGDGNVLDVLVRALRRKLDPPGLPPLLRTVRGVGYVLRAEDPA